MIWCYILHIRICRMPSHGMASGRHGMVFQRCHQHFRVETPQKEVVGRYGYPLVNIEIINYGKSPFLIGESSINGYFQ